MWKWKATEWTLLFLITAAITAVIVLRMTNTGNSYWIRMGIASGALLFLCLLFLLMMKRRRQTRRAILVTGVVVGSCAIDDTQFWSTEQSGMCYDGICSVCLGSPEPNILSGRCKCCNSFFHKQCLRSYWESVNDVLCPNCRFNPVSKPSV